MMTHELPLEVRWGDCDPAGIIWYPAYYRWMDAGSWALLAALGYDAARVRAEDLSFPLVHAACDFLASPRFGERVLLRSRIVRIGRSSFDVAHAFERVDAGAGDGGMLLARGLEKRVWCRYQAGPGSPLASQPLPPELRAAVSAAVSAAVAPDDSPAAAAEPRSGLTS
jgi:YbgC/YbaW family acyl-CoA thioester hydrolase